MDPTLSFTRSVCAAPDDDLPRLVYADWLDEHGDPDRAAFIRLQCELATLTDDSPRRREVAFRARQLEDRHAADWTPPDGQVLEYRFARGFVEMVGVTAGALGEHGPLLFGLNPIRRLWVTGMAGDVHPLRRSVPRENGVTALDLTGNDLTAESLRQLAGFAQLAGVRELGLLFNRLDDEAAQVLCGEAFFQRMQLIRCGANPMATDAGRQRLRDHFGDRVTFTAERDAGYLYSIQSDDTRIQHRNMRAGIGDGFTQVLIVDSDDQVRTAVFDHSGRLLGTQQWPVPPDTKRPSWRFEKVTAQEVEYRFRPAPVRVERFTFPDGEGIVDFSDEDVDPFEDGEYFSAGDREEVRVEITDWLDHGAFGYEFRRFGVISYRWMRRNGLDY